MIMYESQCRTFGICAFCIIKAKIYFICRDKEFLYCYDSISRNIKIIGILPDAETKFMPYIDIVVCGAYLVIVPASTSNVVIYDTRVKKLHTIQLLPILEKNHVRVFFPAMLFHFAIEFNKKAILFGAGSDCIACVDPHTGSVEIETELLEELRKKAPSNRGLFRGDIAVLGDYLYIASSYDGKLVKYSLLDYSFQVCMDNEIKEGYIGICNAEGMLWALGKDGILRQYDKNFRNTNRMLSLFQGETEHLGRLFSFGGNVIFLRPKNRNMYVYSVQQEICREQKFPSEGLQFSGIATWPVVRESAEKCYICDSEMNAIVVMDKNLSIVDTIHLGFITSNIVELMLYFMRHGDVNFSGINSDDGKYGRTIWRHVLGVE